MVKLIVSIGDLQSVNSDINQFQFHQMDSVILAMHICLPPSQYSIKNGGKVYFQETVRSRSVIFIDSSSFKPKKGNIFPLDRQIVNFFSWNHENIGYLYYLSYFFPLIPANLIKMQIHRRNKFLMPVHIRSSRTSAVSSVVNRKPQNSILCWEEQFQLVKFFWLKWEITIKVTASYRQTEWQIRQPGNLERKTKTKGFVIFFSSVQLINRWNRLDFLELPKSHRQLLQCFCLLLVYFSTFSSKTESAILPL